MRNAVEVLGLYQGFDPDNTPSQLLYDTKYGIQVYDRTSDFRKMKNVFPNTANIPCHGALCINPENGTIHMSYMV